MGAPIKCATVGGHNLGDVFAYDKVAKVCEGHSSRKSLTKSNYVVLMSCTVI